VVTGVLCGLAPALQASRAELVPALKDDAAALGRGSPGGGQMGCYRRFGIRNILVVGQVMISTLLLIGAGLFIRSLMGAQAIDPGFTLREGVTATVMPQLGGAYTDAEAQVLYRRMRERAAALPGVRSAALAEFLPLGLNASTRRVYVEGHELPERENAPGIDAMSISPAYFRTMGIPLLRGRDFTEHDDTSAPGVVIVNETMGRQTWPAEDPVGKRLRLSDAEDAPIYEVIGVARDGKYRTLGEAPRPYFYTSIAQEDDFFILTLIVASSAEAETVAMVRQLLDEMAPRLPIFEIKSLSQHLEIMFFLPRMGAGLLAGMGLLGLLLASVGLYGVVAYSVARRTREMGLRMALGASRGEVLRMVIREGMILVMMGTALGVGLALGATRALEGLLYGVTSNDPATFVTVPLFLLGVSLVANFLPARRATGIDPMQALRYE
ncbi:MAG: FtsX-like permease family protein, partial [bacterium]|nr:FtsX-like permease family protein [bacterium]